jgi:hypothetical protein
VAGHSRGRPITRSSRWLGRVIGPDSASVRVGRMAVGVMLLVALASGGEVSAAVVAGAAPAGQVWTKLSTVGPTGASSGSMAYDQRTKQSVYFGGEDNERFSAFDGRVGKVDEVPKGLLWRWPADIDTQFGVVDHFQHKWGQAPIDSCDRDHHALTYERLRTEQV